MKGSLHEFEKFYTAGFSLNRLMKKHSFIFYTRVFMDRAKRRRDVVREIMIIGELRLNTLFKISSQSYFFRHVYKRSTYIPEVYKRLTKNYCSSHSPCTVVTRPFLQT